MPNVKMLNFVKEAEGLAVHAMADLSGPVHLDPGLRYRERRLHRSRKDSERPLLKESGSRATSSVG